MLEEIRVERVNLASEPQTKRVLDLITISKCLNKPILSVISSPINMLYVNYTLCEMHPDTKYICIMLKSFKKSDVKTHTLFNTNQ